jgi:HEAT repeat protein
MITISRLLLTIGVLLIITLLILFYIFYSSIRLEREAKRKRLLRTSFGFLISKAIFYEDGDGALTEMDIPVRYNRLLATASNRQFMIDEIIDARKNLSGIAEANLRKLYEQLGLNKDSSRNLTSRKWHIKAKAIHELAFMDQREHLKKIYRLINGKNQQIRMEAQLAIVQFMGFEGLRFLDILSDPISDWQQMKLLNLLEKLPGHELKSAERWLLSENSSVVSFTLKLISFFQLTELHDPVTNCLHHPDNHIRYQAIECLSEIFNDHTAGILIGLYASGDATYQRHTLNAISKIDPDGNSLFLSDQLSHPNNDVKLAAARALANSSSSGIIRQESFNHSQTYLLNNNAGQVNQEMTA